MTFKATFDEDGYPTEEALEALAHWNYLQSGWRDLMDAAHELFSELHGWWTEKEVTINGGIVTEITVATGGWSGNESVITALHRNLFFWACCWESSYRGGKTIFQIPTHEAKE